MKIKIFEASTVFYLSQNFQFLVEDFHINYNLLLVEFIIYFNISAGLFLKGSSNEPSQISSGEVI